MINKEEIEDYFLPLIESGYTVSISTSSLTAIRHFGVREEKKSYGRFYDLIKSMTSDEKQIVYLDVCISVILKSETLKIAEWVELNNKISTAIKRVSTSPYNDKDMTEFVNIQNDKNIYFITVPYYKNTYINLEKLKQLCVGWNRFFGLETDFKIFSISPEFNPKTGMDIFLKSNNASMIRGQQFGDRGYDSLSLLLEKISTDFNVDVIYNSTGTTHYQIDNDYLDSHQKGIILAKLSLKNFTTTP